MFAELVRTHPNHLVLLGSTRNLGEGWYVHDGAADFADVLHVAAVLCRQLHRPQRPCLAAQRSHHASLLRRHAAVFFAGLCALLVLPDLGNGDLAMLTIVRKTFPAWFLGIVGGAGALTAMVPVAVQLLTGATLYAENLFRPILKPDMNDQQVARLARIMVLVLTLGGLLAAIYTSPSLVSLLLLGSAGIAQLFPSVVLGCSRSA